MIGRNSGFGRAVRWDGILVQFLDTDPDDSISAVCARCQPFLRRVTGAVTGASNGARPTTKQPPKERRMIAVGELGSTIALMPVTYLLALFLAWLNGAPFRIGLRRF